MWRRVAWFKFTDVSEEHFALILKIKGAASSFLIVGFFRDLPWKVELKFYHTTRAARFSQDLDRTEVNTRRTLCDIIFVSP
jgi:hypothetical protein